MSTFRIRRFDPSRDEAPRYDEYALDVPEGVTVLEALLRIQAEQDGTLAFRYSCRGAVCGSCAMVLNGEVGLACRTQVHELEGGVITIEPLPNLPLVRDLVVDMDSFWEKYERVRPWLHAEISEAGGESRMTERQRQKIDQYVNCILCGLCYAACPVVSYNDNFTGPAALAKLNRFLADSREDRPSDTLEQEDIWLQTKEAIAGMARLVRETMDQAHSGKSKL